MWSKHGTSSHSLEPSSTGAEVLFDKIQRLSPKDDERGSLKAQALSIVMDLGQTRWLMYEQPTTSISIPMLSVLVFWLTTLFISFGLFAPRNGTVVASLLISALSVSGAILLILEMYSPYSGLKVSSAPLRAALAHLGE